MLSKNHDGTTQQIDDAVGNFETENPVFLQKAQAVHQARVQEDDVWQKSQVDPVVKQLEAADKQQDAYMTVFRYINDGYGAEADKILQMGQNLQPKQEHARHPRISGISTSLPSFEVHHLRKS